MTAPLHNPNTPHEPQVAPHRGIAGVVFLAMVSLLLAGAVVTFVQAPQKFADLRPDVEGIVKGRVTSQAGKIYEKNYSLQDPATGLWGILRYVLFKTGNDGVVIGKDGWLYTDEEFKSYKDGEAEIARKMTIIGGVDAYLRTKGAQLVVMLVPAKARIYPEQLGDIPFPDRKKALYARVLHELQGRGIYAPDIERVFEAKRGDTQLFMRTDTHWTPAGAEIAATTLAADMHRDCPSISLKPSAFTTQPVKSEPYKGDLERFIPLGPLEGDIGPGKETLQTRQTDAKAEGDANALFASDEIPVILVGTSYSALKQWNFDGALRQALGSDVLNLADEGKGPMVPMDKLIVGNQLETVKPKLVVWEIPERFLEVTYDTKFERIKNIPLAPPSLCRMDRIVTEAKGH